MIKAEIKTDAGVYAINLFKYDDPTAALKYIEDTLKAGLPFEGDDGYLVIGLGALIKHILISNPIDDTIDPRKGNKDPLDGEAPPEEPKGPPIGTAFYSTQKLPILGQDHIVDYAYCRINDWGMYVMIVKIDNQIPYDVLSRENIVSVSRNIGYEKGYTTRVIMPPDNLGGDMEYVAYLQDFVNETVAEREITTIEKKTATAWQGWKERQAGDYE